MKTYIQPNIEIITADVCTILAGSDIHDQKGSSNPEYEFSNTSNFEEEVVPTQSSLWDE